MVQNRSKLTSAGALAFAFGTGLFLLIFPAGERVRHLAMVRDGDVEALPNALRHLCWIRKGQESLSETIPELPLDRRRAVLREARAQGCVKQLSPEIQASYFILEGEIAGGLEHAIAFERDAIGPGFEALEASDPTLRKRGVFVVATLSRLLTEAERERALGILERLPAGPERRLLAMQLHAEEDAKPASERWLEADVEDEASGEETAAAVPDLEEWSVPVQLEEPRLRLPRGGVLFRADVDKTPDEANPEAETVGPASIETDEPDLEQQESDEPDPEQTEPDADEQKPSPRPRPRKQAEERSEPPEAPEENTADAKKPRAETPDAAAEPPPAPDDGPTSDDDAESDTSAIEGSNE